MHQAPPSTKNHWNVAYNGSTAFSAGAKHVGYEIAGPVQKPVFTNVDTVGVESGAELSTTDGVTIKGLHVDMDSAGTISGFDFAGNGVLQVENCRTKETFTLPGRYENVTGLTNLVQWTVYINGKESSRRKVRVDGDAVTIIGTGLTISFR